MLTLFVCCQLLFNPEFRFVSENQPTKNSNQKKIWVAKAAANNQKKYSIFLKKDQLQQINVITATNIYPAQKSLCLWISFWFNSDDDDSIPYTIYYHLILSFFSLPCQFHYLYTHLHFHACNKRQWPFKQKCNEYENPGFLSGFFSFPFLGMFMAYNNGVKSACSSSSLEFFIFSLPY